MGTRLLLCGGVVVGPLYLATGVLQGLFRAGFRFSRHPLSVLANGSAGWIQAANFAITGALVIGAAYGISRVLGKGSRTLTLLLGAYGAAVMAAAVFTADPVDGFPPGTPEGFPTSISTMGLLHFAAGGLGFACLTLCGFVGTWTFLKRRMPALAVLSFLTGLSVAIGFFGGMALPVGMMGIWAAVVMGWIWLSVVCLLLLRRVAASST
jgi:hypothetical protein